jgi:hypothetical protein
MAAGPEYRRPSLRNTKNETKNRVSNSVYDNWCYPVLFISVSIARHNAENRL